MGWHCHLLAGALGECHWMCRAFQSFAVLFCAFCLFVCFPIVISTFPSFCMTLSPVVVLLSLSSGRNLAGANHTILCFTLCNADFSSGMCSFCFVFLFSSSEQMFLPLC